MTERFHNTVFPLGDAQDVALQERVLREKYLRFYPRVRLHKLAKNTGIVDTNGDGLTDEPVVDDLWGVSEPVGTTDTDGVWTNPHVGEADATAARLYTEVVVTYNDRVGWPVHVNHQPTQKMLERHGIDEKRTVMFTFLRSLLDENSVQIEKGDRITWHMPEMEILTWSRKGYWKNTTHYFYIEAVAKFLHDGA